VVDQFENGEIEINFNREQPNSNMTNDFTFAAQTTQYEDQ
jgi:hypothetical protein